MHQAQLLHQQTDKPARVFAEFDYRTHKSWSTSLPAEEWAAQLYEKFSCARGEMENRVKEQTVRRPALHR